MNLCINWKPKALKQLRKLPGSAQIDIVKAVSSLADSYEMNGNVGKLVNHRFGYRLRVGNYRVLFDVVESKMQLLIGEVKKRDERTY